VLRPATPAETPVSLEQTSWFREGFLLRGR
jgi:hypothetical protein